MTLDGLFMFTIAIVILWAVWAIAFGFSSTPEAKPTPIQPEPLKFPVAPPSMAAFPVSVVEQEFTFLLKLLADFQPSAQQGRFNDRDQNVRGTVTYDNAIRPFMEHLLAAVNEHNTKVSKHNGDDAKYANDVTNYVMELERRIKKV
jgi:hypothetical protein